MRFSLIVPVYNVEQYIEKCLQSIVDQTFHDYEVIVVDDETPDNSMDIVRRFEEAYPEKFIVIHQKNKGLGGARNTGVGVARGEYLLFVDSDDYLHPELLQTANQRLTEGNADLMIFNYDEVTVNGKVLNRVCACERDGILETPQERRELLLSLPAAWNKVYRREFYLSSGVTFPDKTWYEDLVTRILVAKAERIALCTEHFYYYVQRSGSIMNSNISPRKLEIIPMMDRVCDAFREESLWELFGAHLEASMLSSALHILDSINAIDIDSDLQAQLIDASLERFPDWKNNSILADISKAKLEVAATHDFRGYRNILRKQQVKGALLRVPLISWLNRLRKRV